MNNISYLFYSSVQSRCVSDEYDSLAASLWCVYVSVSLCVGVCPCVCGVRWQLKGPVKSAIWLTDTGASSHSSVNHVIKQSRNWTVVSVSSIWSKCEDLTPWRGAGGGQGGGGASLAWRAGLWGWGPGGLWRHDSMMNEEDLNIHLLIHLQYHGPPPNPPTPSH